MRDGTGADLRIGGARRKLDAGSDPSRSIDQCDARGDTLVDPALCVITLVRSHAAHLAPPGCPPGVGRARTGAAVGELFGRFFRTPRRGRQLAGGPRDRHAGGAAGEQSEDPHQALHAAALRLLIYFLG